VWAPCQRPGTLFAQEALVRLEKASLELRASRPSDERQRGTFLVLTNQQIEGVPRGPSGRTEVSLPVVEHALLFGAGGRNSLSNQFKERRECSDEVPKGGRDTPHPDLRDEVLHVQIGRVEDVGMCVDSKRPLRELTRRRENTEVRRRRRGPHLIWPVQAAASHTECGRAAG